MNRELLSVIDQIGREKGIDSQKIIKAVESALLTAAKKRYGANENIQVRLDPETGEIEVISLKKIVESVANPRAEISLEEAKKVDEGAELGDEIGSLLEMEDFGRIAAQTAKQVIFQRVREAEWESVHREYSVRQGEIISGMILGQERRNYIVELGKTEALLPAQEQVPRESYRRGDRIRAYLLEVKPSSKGPQIILSRSHPHFVLKLFEMEVPEIAEGVVIIKGVVREPGDRTKIAVFSKDSAVDPVGACVGVRGSRVQAVVRELKGEKIDIVTWTDDPRTFIGEALSPAVIEKVGINEAEKSALVVVSDQQLSLAIGKKGQNVRLASKLTGWKIDIINQGEYEKERAKEREQEIAAAISHEQKIQADAQIVEEQRQAAENREYTLSDVPGVGEKMVEALKEFGIESVQKLAETSEVSLSDLPMIGIKTATKIIEAAKDLLKIEKKGEGTGEG
ncbi:MAG TPA: transcription termination factor NusA [Candidatus Manganitrophaceae bacterium]|nr:transcription termination factor NusA [Candidatus Manganitrophaceae bacterium]